MPNFLDVYNNKQIKLTESKELGYKLYTFTPTPLSSIKLGIGKELMQLLIEAHRKLGEVKGMMKCIDGSDFIINLFRINESISSCRIDSIDIDFLDLFIKNKSTNTSGVTKVNKYYQAMQFPSSTALTQRFLCRLHATVMADDEIEYWEKWQPDFLGNIRTVQTYLSLEKGLSVVNALKYNPTPPEYLHNLMCEMLEYYKENSEYDVLIKLALLHYQFESLHPFLGGNGRVGRLLIHKVLIDNNFANYSLLPFSEYLAQNKIEYFDRLWSAQYSENLTSWVMYFLKGMICSSELTIQRLNKYMILRKKDMDAIAGCASYKDSLDLLYGYLEKNIVIDINKIAEVLSVSFNTAHKIVNLLIEMGILRPLNDKKRYKVYVYSMAADILN